MGERRAATLSLCLIKKGNYFFSLNYPWDICMSSGCFIIHITHYLLSYIFYVVSIIKDGKKLLQDKFSET